MQTVIDQMVLATGGFIPRLIGALVLIVIAWIVATVLRSAIGRLLRAAKIDQRFGGSGTPLSKTIADIVYWFVWLIFLPGILGVLGLEALLLPVQGMVNSLMGFLPKIFGAAIVLFVGVLVARIVRQIVTNLLAAAGIDRLSERLGLARMLGPQKLSGTIGLIVYVFILVPVLIAALDALSLAAITKPASDMLAAILGVIPALVGAAITIIIAVVIGRVLAGLVAGVLSGLGFDSLPAKLGMHSMQDAKRTPSQLVGTLVLIAVVYFAVIEAAHLLGMTLISELAAQFLVFAGQVLAGLIILALGLYLANLAGSALAASSARNAGMLAMVARAAILIFSGAMALRQMGMAPEIINLAFGLLLGAVALASALAFGLGGRDVAGQTLQEWKRTVQSSDTPGTGAPGMGTPGIPPRA